MDARAVLGMAIAREIEAHDLYADVARQSDNPAVRELLSQLAEQEARHRELLEGVEPERLARFASDEGEDRRVAEHLAPAQLSPEAGAQQALIYAMQKEQEARRFYTRLALGIPDERLARLFHELALMEGEHKAKLEDLYEEHFLREA